MKLQFSKEVIFIKSQILARIFPPKVNPYRATFSQAQTFKKKSSEKLILRGLTFALKFALNKYPGN